MSGRAGRSSAAAAYRVITANAYPDHATIARFRERHERALGELFGEVLRLCAEAGLVRVGTVAIDGTKILWLGDERGFALSQAVTAVCRCRNGMTGKGDDRETRPVTEAHGRHEPQKENKYDLAALERALIRAARRLRLQVAALPPSREPVD